MNKHTERIRCPQCKKAQEAIVEHTEPWWTYVHKCEYCSYMILESEWEEVHTPEQIQEDIKAFNEAHSYIEMLTSYGFPRDEAKRLNDQIIQLAQDLESFMEGRTIDTGKKAE